MWSKVLPSLPALSSRGNSNGGNIPPSNGRSRASSADIYSPGHHQGQGQQELDEAAIERMLTDPSWEERQYIQTQVIDVIVNNNDNFRELQRALRRSRVHTNQGVAAMINDATFARKMGRQAIKTCNAERSEGDIKTEALKENVPNGGFAEEGKRGDISMASTGQSEPIPSSRRQRKSSLMRGTSLGGASLNQEGGIAKSGWRNMRVGLSPAVSITSSLESFFLSPPVEEGHGTQSQSANNSPRGNAAAGARRRLAGRRNTTSDIETLFDDHRRPSHQRSSYGSICKKGPADRSYSMINLRQLTPDVVEVLSTYGGACAGSNNRGGDGGLSSFFNHSNKRPSTVQQNRHRGRSNNRAMSSPPSKLRQLFGASSQSTMNLRSSQQLSRLSLGRSSGTSLFAGVTVDDDLEEPSN